ncbi:MAG: LamG domain-containing protein [Spirochaetales bacterium]|nr:LamG domain-containing protein [Spirochaetales bacterium]
MKKILIAIAVILFSILASCSDYLWQIRPTLDNRWDPDNPDYSIPEAIPTEGLEAAYLFNNTRQDSSGNGLHLTGVADTYAADRFGIDLGAMIFDGSNDYLVVPDPDLGKFSATVPKTISFWFKTNGGDDMAILGHSSYHGSGGWSLLFSSSSFHFTTAGGTETVSISGFTDSEWHHAVIMNTDFEITFYLDGLNGSYGWNNELNEYETIDTREITYPIEAEQYFFIGARYTNYDWNPDEVGDFYSGYIDDLRIYSKALTEDEIAALYIEKSM